MAYNDSVRLYLKGDRVKAAQYVRVARVLLWKLARETANGGAASARRTHRFKDGTVIELVLAGLIAAIVITVPLPEGLEPKIVEHFVTFARTEEDIDGIDAEFPQLMHRFEKEADAWRTLFYNKDILGYDTFTGKKGTYRTNDGVPVFDAGIKYAGNVDWRSKTGMRVSWYGPSTRYFYDAHIKPDTQYGKHVFMLGQILLDAQAYMTDSEETFDEQFVMGAALDGQSLLVVHADLPAGITDTTPGPANYADVSPPWPVGDVPIAVCRYALVPDSDGIFYEVANGSREVLWTGVLRNALQPWFFNESATSAVSVGLPDQVMLRYDFAAGPSFSTLSPPPSDTQPVFTLTFPPTGPAVATTSVSMGVGSSDAVVAVDFIGDTLQEMTMRRRPVYDPPLHDLADEFALSMNGAAWVLAEGTFLGVIATRPSYRVHTRAVIFADIRQRVVILRHYQGTVRVNATPIDRSEVIEIWRDGALVGSIELPDTVQNTGWISEVTFLPWLSDGISEVINLSAPLALAPAYPLYQILVAFRPSTHSHWLWQGAHGLVSYLAYPMTERFGVARTNAPGDIAVNRLDEYSDAVFDGDQLDLLGKYSVVGCATWDGKTMLSCYGYEYQTGKSAHFVDGSTLPTLTGVSGTNERYHPIWLLGTLPRQET